LDRLTERFEALIDQARAFSAGGGRAFRPLPRRACADI